MVITIPLLPNKYYSRGSRAIWIAIYSFPKDYLVSQSVAPLWYTIADLVWEIPLPKSQKSELPGSGPHPFSNI